MNILVNNSPVKIETSTVYDYTVKTVGEAAEIVSKKGRDEVAVIHIAPGRYYEKINLIGDNITLRGLGENPADTIITYDDYALFIIESEGVKRGTFRSYTFFADGDHISMENLTIANTAGYGPKVGQAVALYMDGDDAVLTHCHLLGRQDTLFTAPLPPSVIEPGGFRGPKENAPRKNQRHTYDKCYIEGDVDFIFGGAMATFTDCEIKSLSREKVKEGEPHGYATAASTPEGLEQGYIFRHCRFTCDEDMPDGAVYLGRPWRIYARVAIEDCFLDRHINPQGWHNWGKAEAETTTDYRERDNYGPGADLSGRVNWINK